VVRQIREARMIVDPHSPLTWDDALTPAANRLLGYLRSQRPALVTTGRLAGYSGLSNRALEAALGELLVRAVIEHPETRRWRALALPADALHEVHTSQAAQAANPKESR
jgi:hypothetical protein